MQPGVSANAQSGLVTHGVRATWVVQALVSAAAMAAWECRTVRGIIDP
jgi:hypothetical protein